MNGSVWPNFERLSIKANDVDDLNWASRIQSQDFLLSGMHF